MTGGAEPAEPGARGVVPYHPDRLDLYLAGRAETGGPIYLALLLALLLVGASFPIVRVPISVTGRGVVRAQLDGQVLVAPLGGTVVHVVPADRHLLSAGDTVLLLERIDLLVRQQELQARSATMRQESADLRAMIAWSEGKTPTAEPRSVRFGADWMAMREELAVISSRQASAVREAARAAALFERALASAQEAETLRDRVAELRRDSALLVSRSADRWRGELATLRAATGDHQVEQAALAEQLDQLALRAPVDAWLDAVAGLSPGSYLAAGERVATITPASPLVAEIYVDPGELARIRPGLAVRVHAESQRYSPGAGVRAQVAEIYPEPVRAGDVAVARLRVHFERGTGTGQAPARELRRGTAVVGRFEVGRRSLWELLRRGRDQLNRQVPVPDAPLSSPTG